MPFSRINIMLTSSLLLFGLTSHANPLPNPSGIELLRRMEVNYADCDTDQKSKLEKAFGDAATLAENAFYIDTSSKALV